MDNIYVIKTLSLAEEYIQLEGDISKYRIPSMKSELQYIDKNEITMGISVNGGFEVPDIISKDGITFISNRFKQAFDEEHIDYLFYKKVNIISDLFGIHETFWILIPPRIDCLDLDESKIDFNWDYENGLIPMFQAEKIVILKKMLGRFEVFKIAGIQDNNIYLTEKVCNKLRSLNLEGIEYILIN